MSVSSSLQASLCRKPTQPDNSCVENSVSFSVYIHLMSDTISTPQFQSSCRKKNYRVICPFAFNYKYKKVFTSDFQYALKTWKQSEFDACNALTHAAAKTKQAWKFHRICKQHCFVRFSRFIDSRWGTVIGHKKRIHKRVSLYKDEPNWIRDIFLQREYFLTLNRKRM